MSSGSHPRVPDREPGAPRQHLAEAGRADDAPCRDEALHALHHEIDQRPLDRRKQVPDLRRDHEAQVRLRERLLQRVSEVLEHDDRRRPGIRELVLELRRGVERIDIDHGHAGAQRTEQGDRVLQQVGQHDGDALALVQPALQVRGEIPGKPVELAVGNRDPHIRKRGLIPKPHAALLEQIPERCAGPRIDLGGHARRVGLEPDPFHEITFAGSESAARLSLIAARIFSEVAGSEVMRTPTASWIAFRIAAAVGTEVGSPTPLAPKGPLAS